MNDLRIQAIDKMLDEISEKCTKEEIEAIKRKWSGKYGLTVFVRNSELIARAKERRIEHLIPTLRKRPMRSMSGIVNIAIMSMSDCPHGRCTYCPKGENAPNSYTGFEPSTMRGIQNNFDAASQILARLTQLNEIGHATDKCEVIIQGGTFLAQDERYQYNFVRDMYNALNGVQAATLEEAMVKNEVAKHRCIGLTIETRPDWCFEQHVDRMLAFGATRVEIGVQTLDPTVLARTKRGHTIEDVWRATQIAKDSLLKVCYHMMPGLYATPQQDIEMLKQLFEDERYKPDMLKVYPLLVMRNTELYNEWLDGKIKPYTTEQAADVIAEAYAYFPYYVRVMRVQRDIPAYLIEDGVKKSNLRQLVEQRLLNKKIKTGEIRYREVGLNSIKGVDVDELNPELQVRKYTASGGEEYFLSIEDRKTGILFGFLRLRKPAHPHRKEITWNSAGIRELHVYGEVSPIGKYISGSQQHKGIGKRLMEEAERIAAEQLDCKKILVISGIGVRNYYRKLAYSLDGPYMSKML